MSDTKAKPGDVRDFFESNGGPKMSSSEIMALKKASPEGYDAIAEGIGDGTFTYPDVQN